MISMLPKRANLSIFSTALIMALLLTLLPVSIHAEPDAVVSQIKETPRVTTSFTTGSDASPVNANRMSQLAIGLFIVLLCILALAWLARRFNRLQSTPDGSLRLLGGLSMGARERVVLIQVGTQQLLLGVAPGRINTLHVLDEALESVSGLSSNSPDKGFAEKLAAAISRKGQQ